jgi:RNA polymerase sigma-70 factor (ECF subfamily)
MPSSDIEHPILALFSECSPPLHRYVGSFGIGGPDVEDVVQDAFCFLVRHLRQGKSQSNLKGWLFTVAHRLALKHRARTARRRNSVDGDFASAVEPEDSGCGPEDALALEQRRQRLLRVLHAIPERDRRCLYLRAEGLRYREISEVMGMSLGAVSKSLTRSLSRLVSADDASL